MSAQAKFLEGDLTKHIIGMSFASALGFLALFIVDFVDMLFISMLGVDELAAAVGYAGSVLFITTSICIGVGIAAGALVARSLGEGNQLRAKQLLTNVMFCGAIIAVAISALIYTNLDGLTKLVGASGYTQSLTISYLEILIPTMPIMLLGIVATAALRSHGSARLSMNVTLIAGAVNAALDPIFIFWFDLGLEGAAWASVAARLSLAFTGLWYLVSRHGGFCRPTLATLGGDLGVISGISAPAILANVAAPIGGAYVTRVAAQFGESAVAGMAIIGRITPIAFALVFAVSAAIGPIVGQNFGAERHDRVRSAFNRSLLLIVAYVVPIVALLYFSRDMTADLFRAEGLTRDLIFLFCGPLSLAWIFNGAVFVSNASYNNLGRPQYSMWVNLGTHTLGVVPFVCLASNQWGAQGVLIGQMSGAVVAALVAVYLAHRLMLHAECGGDCPENDQPFLLHEWLFRHLHLRR